MSANLSHMSKEKSYWMAKKIKYRSSANVYRSLHYLLDCTAFNKYYIYISIQTI